jgi:gamma-glutamyl phosphate reductase
MPELQQCQKQEKSNAKATIPLELQNNKQDILQNKKIDMHSAYEYRLTGENR